MIRCAIVLTLLTVILFGCQDRPESVETELLKTRHELPIFAPFEEIDGVIVSTSTTQLPDGSDVFMMGLLAVTDGDTALLGYTGIAVHVNNAAHGNVIATLVIEDASMASAFATHRE